jgi:acetyltransferase-like isoleucine patch superfamily enzyme
VSLIDQTAQVEPGAVLGERVQVWQWSKVRTGATVGSGTKIGGGVYVGANVTIGKNCKIENGAQLFEGASLADGVFVGPGVILANDKNPRAVSKDGELLNDEDWLLQGVHLCSGASIGASAVVLPGVVVGSWAVVGAGAVVTRDVADHSIVVGNPARFVGHACRCGRALRDAACAICGDKSPGQG